MIQIEKLRRVMEAVSAERGEFVLFGLFLREEADKWDLVISAPWLDADKLRGLSEFAKKASAIINIQELLTLSRVVTINQNDPNLEKILQAVQVDNGPVELRDPNLFDLNIKHAYILRAKRLRIDIKKEVQRARWSKGKYEAKKISDHIDFFSSVQGRGQNIKLILIGQQDITGKIKYYYWENENQKNIWKSRGIVILEKDDGTTKTTDILDIVRIFNDQGNSIFYHTK